MSQYEEDEYYEDELPEFVESESRQMGQIDRNGHIQVQDLNGVQTKIFHIALPAGVTLETLQSKHRNGVYWQMPDELKETLRHITATRNRANAKADEREGSVKKMLLLSAEVVSERSTCQKTLAVDIPGLVPRVYTDSTRCNWVIQPGNGSRTMINEPIFDPDNMFTMHMLEHNEKCDLATLSEIIRLDHDPEKKVALVESRSVAWKVLEDHLDSPSFADVADAIREENAHVFANPHKSFAAKVPYDVGKSLYESMAEPLREIEKAYTDIDTWRVRFRPADGNAWNNSTGLIQETYTADADSKEYEVDMAVNKPIEASFDLRLSYVLSR